MKRKRLKHAHKHTHTKPLSLSFGKPDLTLSQVMVDAPTKPISPSITDVSYECVSSNWKDQRLCRSIACKRADARRCAFECEPVDVTGIETSSRIWGKCWRTAGTSRGT